MRAIPLCLSCCAVLIALAAPNDLRAEAVKVTPELTVFTDEKTPPADGRPTVLRGSATKRGTVDSRDLSYYARAPLSGSEPAKSYGWRIRSAAG